MSARRTWWHLEGSPRKPSEYDIVTSRLLFYPARGFEVDTPVAAWYARHQLGSALQCKDWDAFRDPRETTYTKYTELQKNKETYVDGVLNAVEVTGSDAQLSDRWLGTLECVLAPIRYPLHGLQMLAAYVGQMAPSGRIVIAGALQAADEMRRIQRCAYRLRQLQETHPGLGADARHRWQRDPLWQPLREVIERLLVTYDFGEAFVGVNLVLKPAFDHLFMVRFARLAAREGDDALAAMFLSFAEDCVWHNEWSRALADLLAAESPANAAAMQEWSARWHAPVTRAIDAFAPLFDGAH